MSPDPPDAADRGDTPDPGGLSRARPPRPPRPPWAWLAAAAVAFPAALGLFWVARESGAARPLCGDRPGIHYPSCQLPAPFGTGLPPPTTTGFVP